MIFISRGTRICDDSHDASQIVSVRLLMSTGVQRLDVVFALEG